MIRASHLHAAITSLSTWPWRDPLARWLGPRPPAAAGGALTVLAPDGLDALGTLRDASPDASPGRTWFPLLGAVAWRIPPSWSRDEAAGHDFGDVASWRAMSHRGRPGADVLRVWARGRLLDVLHAARFAHATGDPGAALHAADATAAFCRLNPVGRGPHWSTAMEVALRGMTLLAGASFLRAAAARVAEAGAAAAALGEAIRLHEAWLSTRSDWRACYTGNHHLVGLAGRYALARCQPSTPWRRRVAARAWTLFWREVRREVHEDGVHFESSTHYHLVAAEAAALLAALGPRHGDVVPRAAARRLAAMAEATFLLSRPDGTLAAIGDSDDGRVLDLAPSSAPPAPGDARAVLALLGLACGHDGLLARAKGSAEAAQHVALLWGRAGIERLRAARPRAPRPACFPEGGIAVLACDSRPATHVTVSSTLAGRGGTGGHAHDDAGSYELWRGAPIVVDRGTMSYTGDPASRRRYRSVASHSALQVDGLEQNPHPPARPFGRGERSRPLVAAWDARAGGEVAIGHHGYFAGGLRVSVLRRLALAADGVLTVTDEVRGAGRHDVVLRIQWAPGVEVDARAEGLRVRRGERPIAVLRVAAQDAMGNALAVDVATVAARHAPRLGTELEARATEVRAAGVLPLIVVHALDPA